MNHSKPVKTPWPTKAAMSQVYEQNLWGGDKTEFFSGEGSHQGEIVNPYIEVLSSFLISFENPLTVCDLGCGDFNVGKNLVKFTKKYIAIDIVKELIDFNRIKFTEEKLEFHCLDLANDNLPVGDCAILRQVLQHLSNAEVFRILNNLRNFKSIILTEHIPVGDFIVNKDIISGQGTRLKKQSGLILTAPPFNFKVKDEKELLSIVLKDGKSKIVTTLFEI